MENTNTPAIQKVHIYRHSDSSQVFCGAVSEPYNREATKVDCEECKAARIAKRQSQAAAARRVIEATKEREATVGTSFDSWMRGIK